MKTFKVVDGKLSENYNYFPEYVFSSCEATNTRLMGVVALKVTWVSPTDAKTRFYQVMHLDYSEYGVDDYFEFECVRGSEDYKEKFDECHYHWNSFVRVMGGDVIEIDPDIMMGLIASAEPLADNNRRREYDNEENAKFRTRTKGRWALMKQALIDNGTISPEWADGCPVDEMEVIRQTSLKKLATCETINYFIMRLIDQDYKAASYLSTIPIAELKQCSLVNQGIQTLIRNSIKKSEESEDLTDDGTHPYRLKMTTLAEPGYYYCTLVVYLDKDYKQKDAKVTAIRVGSINKLSEYEAAVQLRTTEYITVFDCQDRILKDFNGNLIQFLHGVDPEQVNNGWLYTVYNRDNSHVNKAEYWLNDDVYGYALLSIDGEFILMSNKIMNISYMDECVAISFYAPFMTLDGRYQLNDPLFHTLCDSYGVMFRQLVDYPPEK